MARAARMVGVLPVLGAIATATALTGAALFTVQQGTCGDGGQFVQRGSELELVGSCLSPEDLPDHLAPERAHQHGAYGEVHTSP